MKEGTLEKYKIKDRIACFSLRDDAIQGNLHHSVLCRMASPYMPIEIELTDENDDGLICEIRLPRGEEIVKPHIYENIEEWLT